MTRIIIEDLDHDDRAHTRMASHALTIALEEIAATKPEPGSEAYSARIYLVRHIETLMKVTDRLKELLDS